METSFIISRRKRLKTRKSIYEIDLFLGEFDNYSILSSIDRILLSCLKNSLITIRTNINQGYLDSSE